VSRPPSTDRDAAFAACMTAYGVRSSIGAVNITSTNRDAARRWLTACGVPSIIARAASLVELKACWADPTDTEVTTLCLRGGAPASLPQDPAAMVQPHMMLIQNPIEHRGAAQQATYTPDPVPTPAQAGGQSNANSAAAHLAAALAALTQSPAALDEVAVRRIAREVLGGSLDTLNDLQTETRRAIADMVSGAPRVLNIEVNGRPAGALPALRHNRTETLLAFVAQNVPAYVVGPAGSGKTHAAEQCAEALGLPFFLQGATSGAHEFLGFLNAHGHYQSTPFRQAFEHGGVFLSDEIDGSDAAALLVLNAALANGRMAFPDRTTLVARHADFRMIAAANTFGTGGDRLYVGRSQLDASTLDRFAFLDWPYDEKLENALVSDNVEWTRFVQKARASVAKLSIRHVVSPRASIQGAKMLGAGMIRDTVENAVLWRGLSRQDVTRIKTGM
jgi:hypothetical protein